MHSIEVKYEGDLRCSAIHLKSNNAIVSDAPVDNHGKGEAFSPTDLFCTSLSMCMLTIMGIAAQEKNIRFENITADVTKIMGTEPRRVSEIHLHFHVPALGWNEKEWAIMKNAANTCPVAKSIDPSIKVEVSWTSHE